MLLLNFAHPLTAAQQVQITELLGNPPEQVMTLTAQLDLAEPLADQVVALVEQVGLSAAAWQTTPILVIPPGFAPAAACLLAELHGRMGHFPALIWLRPIANALPTRYEIVEALDLQALRDQARHRRKAP